MKYDGLNDQQKQARQSLEIDALKLHDDLTRAWIDQGRPDQVRLGDNLIVDFIPTHNQIWEQFSFDLVSNDLETPREKSIRLSQIEI